MLGVTMLASFIFAGHIPPKSPVSDKVIFYEVFGNPPYVGPAAPQSLKSERNTDKFLETLFKNLPENQAFILMIFTLGENEGNFITASLVFTRDGYTEGWGTGFRGWNIITNRDGKEKIQRTYVSSENKKQATMAFNGALYLVLAEIDLSAVDPKLSAENLDAKTKPYFDYLKSLL
ncbi:MAG: hypothetical protein A3H69_03610 [Candidatus Sungbacteria bacterium RIFCSPLOWO2_02_FULL_47_9]|uniref:Uncharacterized protein n=1 Tax=Candidatus Sungbacteria bacterium RIFCSPHIGHO2_01_FULL_47_32 TaxID=1802264 RepID=A0A1G2K907_9BACT|nr:MAG: hypothetical protein A2633_02455 [Candidatus Sungbacteria bacterium RIFCSPHIGHO2_01_FULL_47_32]OHA12088.1 MAG: hypothetical protein A3H69_03610 [Candidatus Sungbacteria bacterium RIFCSPLOWO2_02_FULL_47_9]